MTVLIAGLGNPGNAYHHTRHNLGFLAVDAALNQWGGSWKLDKTWTADIAKTRLGPHTVLLAKPQTFMNLSGESVGPLARYCGISPDKILVVVDDINLAFGRMRFRPSGSAGGHNGLKSVEQHLGTANYPRLRLGVGAQKDERPLTDHVLGRFSPAEMDALPAILDHAAEVMAAWLTLPPERLMPLANGWTLPSNI